MPDALRPIYPSRRSLRCGGGLAWTLAGLVFVRLASAQLLPPGALNPAAGSDSGADFFIEHIVDDDGVIHAVWASQHDYSGRSGSDPDIWHASNDGGGWSQPAQVNGYYNTADEGSRDDREPAIAAAPDGTLYCVWSSDFDGFRYGPDYDVFVSVREPGVPFWSDPLSVNDATTDSTDDRHPAVAVTATGRPVVLWEGTNPQYPYDQEVFWSYFSPLGWTSPESINRSDTGDWDDVGPISLAASDDGQVLIAAWSANDLFQSDIMLAEFFTSLFQNFGAPVNLDRIPQPWSEGWASSPAIAVHGTSDDYSVHVAFASRPESGGDTDIFYRLLVGSIEDQEPRPFWSVNRDADLDVEDDRAPDICVEPADSVHVVWQRASAGDDDVYYSASSRPIGAVPAFSPAVTPGGQGAADDPGEHDLAPDLECYGDGLLSVAWNSLDDLGGPLGADWDILHSLGLGRLFTPPDNGHPYWSFDDDPGDDDVHPALVARPDGSVVMAWTTSFPIPNTGTDREVVWSELDPSGVWTSNAGHPMPGATFDAAVDDDPALVVAPSGHVYCVYVSGADLDGTMGSDLDVVYSDYDGKLWRGPYPVGRWGSDDNALATADDRAPAALVTADGALMVAWAAPGAGVVTLRQSGSGWQEPEPIGPASAYDGADAFAAVTLALDDEGREMVAFTAYDGLTGLARVFWSRREAGGWLPVENVGPALGDGPPVLATVEEQPILVWASNADVLGAGTDADLLTARRSTTWSAPVPLLLAHLFDADTDFAPTGAVRGNVLYLAWMSDVDLGGTAGSDEDVVYAEVPLDAPPPVLLLPLLADPSGHADGADPHDDPALAVARERVVVAWSKLDSPGADADWDVSTSQLRRKQGLFSDDFESGDTARWSSTVD